MTIPAVDDATFEERVLRAPRPVIVDFKADWCGPCRLLAPQLEEVARRLGDAVDVVSLDIEANEAIARQYDVRSIPMLVLFDGGRIVRVSLGFRPADAIIATLGLERAIPAAA